MNYNNAEFYTSYGNFKQIPKSERTEIAFSGRSNVGKSSLINKIFNRKSLAKVAKSDKERWAGLIEGYLHDDRELALVFQLIDFRHPPTSDDVMMVNFLIDSGIPFVVILTKADKLSKKQREERRASLLNELPCAEDITIIEFSAQTGEGRDEIRAIIEEIAADDETEETEE